MTLKFKKKSIVYLSISIIMLITMVLLSKVIALEIIGFYVNLLLLLMIVAIAQFSLFSLLAVLGNYVLINVFVVYKTKMGYGLIAMTSHIYMKEMCIMLLIFNLSLLLWIVLSDILLNEHTFFIANLQLSKKTCNLFAFLSLVFSYIAFPSFSFGITDNRFNALLPGHFWNHFMVIFLIIASLKIKESFFVKFCVLIVSIWVLLHGERVDIIGFYAFLFLRYCNIKEYRINFKFIARFGIIGIILFTILIYIGETRVGGVYRFSINSLITSFFAQGTASDVGYVFNSAINYNINNGLLLGKTYLTYIYGIIPFLDQPMRAGSIIQRLYKTAGGEFILVEPLINFGYIGVFLVINILIFVLYKILSKTCRYRYLVFFFLTSTAFRYMWYGLTYIETGLLYLLPLTYFMLCIMSNKKSIGVIYDR